jgi:hypothetical protein
MRGYVDRRLMTKELERAGTARGRRREMARALRAARKNAGFESASAAAERFVFSNAKYRSHEAGNRTMSAEDIQRYARAFKVPVKTIAEPDSFNIHQTLEEVRRKRVKASSEASKARKAAGNRLKIARLARGYDSARGAAREFKLAEQTYLGHEAGKSGFSLPAARLYAALLGVRLRWLLAGDLPSGLGPSLDAQLVSGLKPDDVHHYRQLVALHRKPKSSKIAELEAALRADEAPGWTKDGPDIVREISASELRRHGLDALGLKPTKFWPFPKGFARAALEARPKALVVVVCDNGLGRSFPGDRLVVDTSRSSPLVEGEFLGIARKELIQFDARASQHLDPELVVVGKILATIALRGFAR